MTKIEEVARAIETRRRELIAQPLVRIYTELALAAVYAMREPSEAMKKAGWQKQPDIFENTTDYFTPAFTAAIDAALAEYK